MGRTAKNRYMLPRTSNIRICRYGPCNSKHLKIKYGIKKLSKKQEYVKNTEAYLKNLQIEPPNIKNVNVTTKKAQWVF